VQSRDNKKDLIDKKMRINIFLGASVLLKQKNYLVNVTMNFLSKSFSQFQIFPRSQLIPLKVGK
jgi:hypothetical protein